MNKRVVIMMQDDLDSNDGWWDPFERTLVSLGIENISRSTEIFPVVVTGTVEHTRDLKPILEALNSMPGVKNAEKDSWSSGQ